MQWLKTFSAVLAAGLLVFGLYRYDIQMDRDAAEWDLKAAELAQQIESSTRILIELNVRAGLRSFTDRAREHLALAPKRAKGQRALASAIEDSQRALDSHLATLAE